jgi:ribosomal protein S8E
MKEERKGTREASKRAARAQRVPEANSRVSSNGLNREHHTSREETPQTGSPGSGSRSGRPRCADERTLVTNNNAQAERSAQAQVGDPQARQKQDAHILAVHSAPQTPNYENISLSLE